MRIALAAVLLLASMVGCCNCKCCCDKPEMNPACKCEGCTCEDGKCGCDDKHCTCPKDK